MHRVEPSRTYFPLGMNIVNHLPIIPVLKKIVASIVVRLLLTLVASTSVSEAQNVEINAQSQWVSKHEIQLTIEAVIAPGVHIYSLEQVRPILATHIQIDPNESIESVGTFQSVTSPKRHIHEQLGIEVQEHFDRAQWTVRVYVRESQKTTAITGSIFAQACEDEKCFPPETHTFRVEIGEMDDGGVIPTVMNTTEVANSSAEATGNNTVQSFLDSLEVPNSESSKATSWSILPLAFVAGFLLNFMPCVLPVVGIKLLSLVKQSKLDYKRVVFANLFYSAGLISVMIVLASFAVFAGLGWGQQFSNLWFSVTLIGIVFAFSLSLLGVWEIPSIGFSQSKGERNQYVSSFNDGVLCTVLATPCSGPFLGAVLAWAVSQPVYWTYAVFIAIGLGMASPFLLIGFFPALTRYLPKPGAWMIVFKQLTGFVMLASVVYLLSTLPVTAIIPSLLLLVAIGMALWATSLVANHESSARKMQVWFVAGCIVVVGATVSFGWIKGVTEDRFERDAIRFVSARSAGKYVQKTSGSDASTGNAALIDWEDYSTERLESLLQSGKPVFIDFTADWCLTCKSNELLAIETPDFAKAIRAGNVVAMRADKTAPNPDVDSLLRKLGNSSASIPFYAVFPAREPNKPIVMDGLYSSPEPFVTRIQSAL